MTNPERSALIERNGLFFYYDSNDVVTIYNGHPDEAESEFIGMFHKSLLGNVVAGLTALKQQG